MSMDWQNMRAGDSDRQRTLDLLKAAFSEGRLSPEEHAARSEQAMRAQTYGDLQRLVTDLPTGVTPMPAPSPPPSPPAALQYPPQLRPAGPVPPTRPRNPLASASLALGLLSFLTWGVTSVPAIITGHLGLNRIRQTGEEGQGMAVTGMVIGYATLAFLLLRVVIWISTGI